MRITHKIHCCRSKF